MTRFDSLRGRHLYLDTNIFIAAVERPSAVGTLFALLAEGAVLAQDSVIALVPVCRDLLR